MQADAEPVEPAAFARTRHPEQYPATRITLP